MSREEKQFLLQLMRVLLKQGEAVHEVIQQLARSLKKFVQSREYIEQRRIAELLSESQRSALKLKNSIKIAEGLQYRLSLTGCRFKSLSQMRLFDPSGTSIDGRIFAASSWLFYFKSSAHEFTPFAHTILAYGFDNFS